MDHETNRPPRRQCPPCWVVIVFGAVTLLVAWAWIAHVADMVASGRGLETAQVLGLYRTTYIEALVFICAVVVALAIASFLNIREYLLWRDFQNKYGNEKPNRALNTDAERSRRAG